MAGSALAFTTRNSEGENDWSDLQISASIDEWQVEYARFINCSTSAYESTHPSLEPIPKNRLRGNWMSSTDTVSAKLIYERSSAGTDDAVLILTLRSKILELHYISKMHFSWPQISCSCMPGLPARGSRAVFLSCKDGSGQIQKFAFRFSSVCETEKFLNVIKEIMKNGSPPLLQCPELNSEMSSQAEAISSHVTASQADAISSHVTASHAEAISSLVTASHAEAISSHATTSKSDVELQCTQSTNNINQVMLLNSALKSSQYSEPHQGSPEFVKTTKEDPVFPPSFTQLLNSCGPTFSDNRSPSAIFPFDASLVDSLGAAIKTDHPGNLKAQFRQYLEGTSFQELVATVENVINQLGDNVVL